MPHLRAGHDLLLALEVRVGGAVQAAHLVVQLAFEMDDEGVRSHRDFASEVQGDSLVLKGHGEGIGVLSRAGRPCDGEVQAVECDRVDASGAIEHVDINFDDSVKLEGLHEIDLRVVQPVCRGRDSRW